MRRPLPSALRVYQPPYGTQLERDHPLVYGLVGAFALNEQGGGTVVDSVGRLVGTFVGTTIPKWTPTPLGSGVVFLDTSATKITTLATTPVPPLTLAARFRSSASGIGTLIGSSNTNGLQFRFNNGLQFLKAEIANIGTSSTALSTDRWYDVAVTYDGTVATFYVDGSADGSGSSAQTFVAGTLVLGARYNAGGEGLNGDLDYAFAWNRVLSPGEIRAFTRNPYVIYAPSGPRHFALSPQVTTLAPDPTPTFVGAGTAAYTASASATVTPGLPTGWAADDIHVLVAAGSNNTDWPEPSGWTKISPSAASENNGAGQRVEVWVRRAVGGDTAPVLSTYTGTTVRGARIYGIRGCPTSGAAEDTISVMSRSNNAASATVTFATITPAEVNTRLLAVYAYEDDPTAASTMSGWDAFAVDSSTLGTDMALGNATRAYPTTSATGSLTTTVSGGTFANSVNVGLLFAFRPITAAPVNVTPAAAVLNVSALSPAVVLGATSVTPAVANASLTALSPTVVLGSISRTVAPAILNLSALSPTVTLGPTSVTPAVATATLTAVTPTVALGSTSVTPAIASATLTAITPAVVLGSLSITPTPAVLSLSAISPTVALSSTSITPAVSVLALTAISPTVALGSTSIAPAPAILNLSAPNPTVSAGGNIAVTPAAAVLNVAAVTPSVVLGAASVAPAIAAVSLSAVTPTIVLGVTSVTPAAAVLLFTAPTPSVSAGGDVAVTPAPAGVSLSAITPAVTLGSISITPAPAALTLTAITPTVSLGATSITPALARLNLSAPSPTVQLGSLALSPTAAALSLTALTPTVSLGATSVTPSAALLSLMAITPGVLYSSTAVAPGATVLLLSAVSPIVVTANQLVLPLTSTSVGVTGPLSQTAAAVGRGTTTRTVPSSTTTSAPGRTSSTTGGAPTSTTTVP